MSQEQNVNVEPYSIVVMNAHSGLLSIMSRAAGTDRVAAIVRAQERRNDFPDAEEIRVVHPTEGIVFTC
jgi:hypothetical protein